MSAGARGHAAIDEVVDGEEPSGSCLGIDRRGMLDVTRLARDRGIPGRKRQGTDGYQRTAEW